MSDIAVEITWGIIAGVIGGLVGLWLSDRFDEWVQRQARKRAARTTHPPSEDAGSTPHSQS